MTIHVTVRDLSGKEVTFDLEPETSIEQLRLLTQSRMMDRHSFSCPAERQRLVFSGQQMHDAETMRSRGFSGPNTLIHCILKPEPEPEPEGDEPEPEPEPVDPEAPVRLTVRNLDQ